MQSLWFLAGRVPAVRLSQRTIWYATSRQAVWHAKANPLNQVRRASSEVARTVYVNGEFVPEVDAKISVFDRGFLMSDAVYEVTAVVEGKLLDFDAHLVRLERSLGELGIGSPCDAHQLLDIHRSLIARNRLDEGLIYLQVSRGACDRDFVIPADIKPSLVLFTQAKAMVNTAAATKGVRVISANDMRWQRRDIKTTQLLAPSLAKSAAKRAGVDDAWMVEDGMVTEGTSNNVVMEWDPNPR